LNPIALHAFNPGPMTGDGNWAWLLPGRVPTLVDAGTGDPRFLAALDEALAGQSLRQVLVTHAHPDHASGAPALVARFPGVRMRKLPWPGRDSRWPVPWELLADGDTIEAGDTSLVAVHTPGHAPDHLCFWHEGSRTIFAGDLAVKGTTIYIPPSLGGNLSDYLASLERVRALAPARLLPAHGPPIENPDRVLSTYVAHRLERERQIVGVVGSGTSTLDAIVASIYGGLDPALLPMAKETVLAHLIKLERDGRARHEADAWHMISP
jgi:glyoxylase-like metal-dependent hydrolase (beta-lactamase superfamily II)